MNKGLFTHTIATIVYILCVLYVVGEEETTLLERLVILMFFIISQMLAAMISDLNGF